MKMHGNFEIAPIYEGWLDFPEWFNKADEISSYYVRVKFENSEVIRTRSAGFSEFKDTTVTYSFIARDKKTLERLKKFIETDLFKDIMFGRLGLKGKIDINL